MTCGPHMSVEESRRVVAYTRWRSLPMHEVGTGLGMSGVWPAEGQGLVGGGALWLG
jgi:hypothetical protein